jgi:hypothetical protein
VLDLKSLDVGLNEATLVGVEFDVAERMASITLSVLTLPDEGPAPEDPRVLMMRPVGRVAASWRHGRWDNPEARVELFGIEDLHSLVERLGGRAIYGWEFFDVPDEVNFASWRDRLSLDWRADCGQGMSHTLRLFQEVFGGGQPEQHLDLQFVRRTQNPSTGLHRGSPRGVCGWRQAMVGRDVQRRPPYARRRHRSGREADLMRQR